MKRCAVFTILFCSTLSFCIANCFSINRDLPLLVPRSLSLIRSHPKMSISVALSSTCAIGYAVFHFLRERKIKNEKNIHVELTRVGVDVASRYFGSTNIENAYTWGKRWSLHEELVNVNGRAVWRFTDEHGIFEEIEDRRHTYEQVQQTAGQAAAFLARLP